MKPTDPLDPPNLKARYWGAVGFSAIFSVLIGLLELKLSTDMGDYGYWLFLGLPFLQGLSCSFWLEAKGPVSFLKHVTADLTAITTVVSALFFFAAEGACYLTMAYPLIIGASFIGSGLAHWVMGLVHRRRNVVSASLFAIVPFLLLADSLTGGKPSVRTHSTEMVINATPKQIWPYLSELDTVRHGHLIFRAGVAHPLKIHTLEA
ncbi:MAG: hypothetical protein H7Y17_15680 [Chlorobia bacterium]|nr:hypothetical protein [Fimbriimonadaceae bacterium]